MQKPKVNLRNLEQEVEKNYKAFLSMSFKSIDNGKWALMKDGKVVEILVAKADADKMGQALYSDGVYSFQRIGNQIADLGYMSYAVRSN